MDWPTPHSTKHVEQFLGLVNYHRSFIKDYAKLSVPLYALTGKHKFKWDEEHEQAFQAIKEALTSPPVLALPNKSDPFILDTDASDKAIGAEIIQVQEGKERVIAYGSTSLSAEQRNYCTTRKELLAVIKFTRQFKHYLLGRKFLVRTDHNSLIWLLNFKHPQGQLARWIEELSQFDMEIQHRPGKKHCNADALSRIPEYETVCPNYRLGLDIKQLPCGGCNYCARAHKNWSPFEEEVDYAVPLADGKSSRVEGSTRRVNWSSADGMVVDDRLIISQLDIICQEDQITVVGPDESLLRSINLTNDALSTGDTVKDQKKDPDLKVLRDWLINQSIPAPQDLQLASPAEKYYWINRESFQLKTNVVWKSSEEGKLLLVIPRAMQQAVLSACHDPPSMGHQGISRTKARLHEKYFWYGMSKSVGHYVQSCSVCNKHKKPNRHARFPLTCFQAGLPMERVHLDFLGPLPQTAQGNEYVLMMVDQFTKWVECIALPSQTAEVTAQAAVNQFFARFGCPFKLQTDRGSNFESKLFASVCELLHIQKTRTTPYRPSANGQVERYNRTLMDAVRCYIRNQKEWDQFLPQLAGALRSSVNRQTGFTANKMMLGREVNQPVDLMFPLDKTETTQMDQSLYVTELEAAISLAHQTARDTLRVRQKRMKGYYDLTVLERSYKVGDPVYVLDTSSTKGKTKKLCPPWKGPGIILEKITPAVFRVKLKTKVFTINHDRLKLCKDRTLPEWIVRLQKDAKLLEEALKAARRQSAAEAVFCTCRKPDDGKLMIQCDTCLEWYHGACIGVSRKHARNIKSYKCSSCTTNLKALVLKVDTQPKPIGLNN